MKTHVTSALLLSITTLFVISSSLPFSFMSQKHPSSLLLKIQAEPQHQFRLESSVLIPRGSRKTTLNTFGPNIISSPPIEQDKILFNEKHQGKYVLAFYDRSNSNKIDKSDSNFHFIRSQYNEQVNSHLLPLFSQEMPSFRIDKLFRCQDTLVSVQWRQNDAHIVAFSHRGQQWTILQSIDGGFSGQDHGVRFGYAIDKGHTHPIVIDMGGHKYCQIDKSTIPAVIQNTWNEQFYSLDQILNLVSSNVQVVDKLKQSTDEL